jgi:hypothetical protein
VTVVVMEQEFDRDVGPVIKSRRDAFSGRVDLHHHFFPPTPLLRKFMADAPAPGPIFGYTGGRSLEAGWGSVRVMDVDGWETTGSIRCSPSSIGAELSCIHTSP